MSYKTQNNWKEIQSYLPAHLQLLSDNDLPTEETWLWQGHFIHLDTYRNPNAKVKLILFHGKCLVITLCQ
jgi:hypothetical protein